MKIFMPREILVLLNILLNDLNGSFLKLLLIFSKLIISHLLFMKESMLLYNKTTFRRDISYPFYYFLSHFKIIYYGMEILV